MTLRLAQITQNDGPPRHLDGALTGRAQRPGHDIRQSISRMLIEDRQHQVVPNFISHQR